MGYQYGTRTIYYTYKWRSFVPSVTHSSAYNSSAGSWPAKMLLYKAQGHRIAILLQRLDVNINTVKLCLSKFREGGVQRALFDDKRKGRPVEITDDAIAWIISIACQRPADLGYAQELWTLKIFISTSKITQKRLDIQGLQLSTKPMVQKILNQSEIRSRSKSKYYCEKRDAILKLRCMMSLLFTNRLKCSLTKTEHHSFNW